MNTYRTNAVVAGVLYIIGTVAGVLSRVLSQSLGAAVDPLAGAAANANQLTGAALCVMVMCLALAMVPVVLYPILRRHSEVLALGYVVFRGGLETVVGLVTPIAWLLLVALGQLHVQAQTAAALLWEPGAVSAILSIVFCLGAAMFYTVLYRSRLVPRWLSVWGMAGLLPYLAAAFTVMFAGLDEKSSSATLMYLPLAVQEMVLAVWLIAKGFNSSAVAPEAAKTTTNELLSAA